MWAKHNLVEKIPFTHILQKSDGDFHWHDLALLDVLGDELAIGRAAVPGLSQQVPSREVDKAKLLRVESRACK